MEARRNILTSYKRLIKLCHLMKDPKKSQVMGQIRLEFRKNISESNPAIIAELLNKAASSLGFLKIITPKEQKSQQGTTRIVYSDGSDASSGSNFRPVTNWHGSNMDPDSVRRHQHSLKRAGFKGNSDAKGIF
eukprot:gene5504-11092_t